MLKRGQFSMEYMMGAGVVLLFVLAGVYLYFEYSQSTMSEVKDAEVIYFGNDIVHVLRDVYYQGKPTRIVVRGTLPNNVEDIRIVSDEDSGVNLIFFYMRKQGGVSQIVFSSPVRLAGNINPHAGMNAVLVSAQVTRDETGKQVPYVYLSSEECGDGFCNAVVEDCCGEPPSCVHCFEDCGSCGT